MSRTICTAPSTKEERKVSIRIRDARCFAPRIGCWFHSVDDDGAITWQGRIVREPRPGVSTVQLYSWLDGRPTEQRIIPVADMTGWRLYGSNAAMRAVGDRLFERR